MNGQISEERSEEPIIARIETTGIEGEYHHVVNMGTGYTKNHMAGVYAVLKEHESKIGERTMKAITQINTCGTKKMLTQLLN